MGTLESLQNAAFGVVDHDFDDNVKFSETGHYPAQCSLQVGGKEFPNVLVDFCSV